MSGRYRVILEFIEPSFDQRLGRGPTVRSFSQDVDASDEGEALSLAKAEFQRMAETSQVGWARFVVKAIVRGPSALGPWTSRAYIGIDVGVRRGCACVVMDDSLVVREPRWLPFNKDPRPALRNLCQELRKEFEDIECGIDAPRTPLLRGRRWKWTGDRGWSKAPHGMAGRHCEIVLKATSVANPQWTPVRGNAPEWMELGFQLFDALSREAVVHEVFPTASHRLLDESPELLLSLPACGMARGPKDVLDATVAALTVREFRHGRGCEVGGGDGLGTIVLPRRLDEWLDPDPPRGSPNGQRRRALFQRVSRWPVADD